MSAPARFMPMSDSIIARSRSIHGNRAARSFIPATWSGSVLPTQARINGSGNTCTLVAQPDRSHTVDLSLGGEYWPATRPFLWDKLRLAALP